jgi:hypothetical protein
MEEDPQKRKVPPFVHQAISMPSCPHSFSFRPMLLHVSHFPCLLLTTCHRHHVPRAHADNEMARCVHEDTYTCSRTCHKAFQIVGCRACLYIYFSGRSRSPSPRTSCLLTAAFGILTTCAWHVGCHVSRPFFRAFHVPSCVLRFEPAWSSVGVLFMRLMPASRLHFCPHCTRIWRAVQCPKPQLIAMSTRAIAVLVTILTPLAPYSPPWSPTALR